MIKLLIGGSPCTHWSIAQRKNRETKAEGLGWELFRNFVIAKEKFQPDCFLYENNWSASKEIKEQIQEELHCELMRINSNLVSAQNRDRFYVFNWEVEQPEDRGILLKDILESGSVWREKSYCIDANYYKGGSVKTIGHQSGNRLMVTKPIRVGCLPNAKGKMIGAQSTRIYSPDGKSVTLKANAGGQGAKTGLYALPACLPWERTEEGKRLRKDYESGKIKHGFNEYRKPVPRNDGKTNTLTTVQKDNMIIQENNCLCAKEIYNVENGFIKIKSKQYPIKLNDGEYIIRKLTPIECERLQTMPDNYTACVSNTQRYKGLGNGWTAEVIIHILNGILKDVPKDEKILVLSMYDGIGTGRYCLDKMGFANIKYYAYEIDKYARAIALSNYPDIIQCGDAFQVREDNWTI